MQKFFSEAAAYVRKNRRHRAWLKVVSCLGCVVVFCTTYALILPAITLEGSGAAYCGLEEHVHTDECYTQELICGQEEAEGHVHTDECYGEPVLTCGLEEHTHTDECYVDPNAETAPAQAFTGEANGVTVTVSAPEGAFPEGTEMSVGKAAQEAVQAAADAVNADAANVQAVDITFTADGQEIEPALPISVKLESALVAAAEDAVVVHVDDAAQAEVISDATVEDEAITFEADAFSVYAIIGKDENGNDIEDPRYTVEFYTGNGMTGDPYEIQLVKANDTLVRPETPEILEGYNEFLGWYIGGNDDDNDGTWTGGTEVQFGAVTEDWLKANATDGVIQVHARFINAIHVTFYDCQPNSKTDEDSNTVEPAIVTTRSMTGGPIDLNSVTAEPWQAGTVFDKWVDANGNAVSSPYTATEDTSLYATFVKGYSLVFDANGDGASSTATQYLKEGEKPEVPASPARPGYTFQGWYTEATGGTQFSFNSALTEDTTVYAQWAAATANYTVVFWQQKVSDDKDAAEANRTYDYVSSEERSATTGATVNATGADMSKDYTGFHYSHADTNVVVAADGSTILNVYYDRDVISLTFNPNSNSYYILVQDGGEYDSSTSITYNGQTYARSVTYKGLYASEIYFEWPSSYLTKRNNNQYSTTTCRWSYNKNDPTSTSVNDDNRMTTSFLANFILSIDGTSITYTPNTSGTLSHTVSFYRQNADGTWPDEAELTVNTANNTNWNITDKYLGFTAYQYKINNNGKWVNVGTWDEKNGYYNKIEHGEFTNLYIRYKRNTYTIDFMNGSQKVDSASLLYGAALNTVTAPSGENLTYPGASGDAASHYTFLGWYSAPVGGEKLDFATTKETMPANNLVAYAQWAPEQLTVTYDANGGTFENITDNPTETTVTVDYDTKLTNVPTPYNEGYTFLGWVDEAGNAWNFETAVTEDITLYAQWHTDHVLNVVYYTVDGNGNYVLASATDSNQYDDGATAIVRPYGKEGARFIGWSLGEYTGDDSALYEPGDEIEVSSATDRADGNADYTITLYAVFDELPSTSITFDANGGTFGEDVATEEDGTYVKSLANNKGVDLDTIQPTREGYKLIGWSTIKNGEVVYKADGTEGTEEIAVDNINEGSNILYAVWEEIPKVDLTIKKTETGKDDVLLSGAEFVLYYTKDETNYYYNNGSWSALPENTEDADAITLDTVKQTTDTDGTTTFKDVEDGEYYLKEIKAPDGYKLLENEIIFTVKDGQVVSAGSYTVSDGTTITVPNSAGIELPHTGGAGTYFYTYSGLLLMAGAVVYGYTLRRKRERRTVE